jgi:hypothetical protein
MKKQLKKAMSVAVLALEAALFTGCASGGGGGSQLDEPPTPDSTSAVVYFMRPGAYAGSVAFSLWDGDTAIGSLKGKQYVAYKTTPGTHYFLTQSQNWDIIKAELAAGKTYYILFRAAKGFTRPFVNMIAQDPDNADIPAWIERSRGMGFTDAWRENFAQGKRLRNVQSALEKAKNGSVNVEELLESAGK